MKLFPTHFHQTHCSWVNFCLNSFSSGQNGPEFGQLCLLPEQALAFLLSHLTSFLNLWSDVVFSIAGNGFCRAKPPMNGQHLGVWHSAGTPVKQLISCVKWDWESPTITLSMRILRSRFDKGLIFIGNNVSVKEFLLYLQNRYKKRWHLKFAKMAPWSHVFL